MDVDGCMGSSEDGLWIFETRLQPVRRGVESFSRLTIKVFLAFYITSSANVDGGPFNDLNLHPWARRCSCYHLAVH